MDIITIVSLVLVFGFPHMYGVAENRLFYEHGEYLPGRHFRVYHLWLALLFAGDAFIVYSLSRSIWLAASFLVYAPFALDWMWWVIRYIDITYLGKNDYDGGTGKPWHSREDWDNYLGLPLILGTYWWWYPSAALTITLLTIAVIT